MATSKTVNVTTGKILNYQITKAGYKPVTGSVYVDGDKTINVNMIPTTSSVEVYTLGDRILDMASFVCYYTPGGDYDTKPISTTVISQTIGNGLKNIGVKKGIFESKVNPTYTKTARVETHEFTYDGTNWIYDNNPITLSDYGIFYNTVTSTVSSGDKLTVIYSVYNKYACFVLDANYRTYGLRFRNSSADITNYPFYGSVDSGSGSTPGVWYINQLYGQESASWFNRYILDNSGYQWSEFPSMNYCRTLGKYILANGLEIYPLVPNLSELNMIYNNRIYLDSIDPWIQSGHTEYNLSNWTQSTWSSVAKNNRGSQYNSIYYISTNGQYQDADFTNSTLRICPVFEIPCM